MTSPIVVISALPDELTTANAPPGVEIVYSGIGKLNAAIATARAIHDFRPQLLVNFGTAGRVHAGVGGLISIGAVIQRDMQAMPLAPRGTTPFDSTPALLRSGVSGALCATGDSFVTSTDRWLTEQGADIVDMELFAIALTCHRLATPWRAFKFITDDANDNSAKEWQDNVMNGEVMFWDAFRVLTAH